MNNDAVGILRLKVIVPVTSWNEAFVDIAWMVRLDPTSENKLSKVSAADTFQLRSVSEQWLIRYLGFVSEAKMTEITSALAFVLALDH